MRGGDERPEPGFGRGEVVEPRAWVGIGVDDGGVLGRDRDDDRFLACKSKAEQVSQNKDNVQRVEFEDVGVGIGCANDQARIATLGWCLLGRRGLALRGLPERRWGAAVMWSGGQLVEDQSVFER